MNNEGLLISLFKAGSQYAITIGSTVCFNHLSHSFVLHVYTYPRSLYACLYNIMSVFLADAVALLE